MTEQETYNYLVYDVNRWHSFNTNKTLHLRNGVDNEYRKMSREVLRYDPDMSCGQCMAQVFTRLHNWRIANKEKYERKV
mgnify:CR=1 FL=1|tara:strand:- start:768 stop:1004 length:237 start_codon:yes stop_codon:yes gene_type:complete